MTDLVKAAQRVRQLIEDEPGITSSEIAERINVTRGRVSQVVRTMREADEVRQIRKGRDGAGLHLTQTALTRKIIKGRWR